MNKIYLNADDLLHDSYLLAKRIYDSGFRPNIIVGVWRGGTPVAIAVQEFLEYVGVSTDHIAIRTSSYTGLDQQNREIRVHGLQYIADNANAEDKMLLVDDVFDSGRSMRAVVEALQKTCRRNLPATIRIACPWFKPGKNVTDMRPDYHLHETEDWLVFPHELKGIPIEEISAGKGRVAQPLVDCLESIRREGS